MKKFWVFFTAFFIGFSLFASTPVSGISVSASGNGYLEFVFEMPEYSLQETNTKNGVFYKINCPDMGYEATYGRPMLPKATFSLMLKGNVVPEIEIVSYQKKTVKLDFPVFPVQKPWPKSRKLEDRPFVFDTNFYQNSTGNDKLYSVGKPFVVRGKNGISITLYPFDYNAKEGILTVYSKIKFRVKNVSVDSEYNIDPDRKLFSSMFLNYFVPDFSKGKTVLGKKLLIITPANFTSTLSDFISHKQSLGFTVDVATLDDTGHTKDEIKSYIQTKYDNVDTRPDFVILVGDTAIIPEYVGNTTNNPHTDLYYSTLAGNDYFPDVYLGRISVNNEQELQNALKKIIDMDSRIGGLPKKACFITADDNYQITEGTHNYVIANYFKPDGYACDKLYAETYGVSVSEISDTINEGRNFVVYSGHGNYNEWSITYSIRYRQSDIRNLTNTVYPFVLSFACLTGRYEYTECFGETWLRAEHGACAFWGSSVYSYWDEDDVLERMVFKSMFVDNMNQIGPMFVEGKIYLYQFYNGTGSTERYFQQYNLFGDPSTYTSVYEPVSMGALLIDKELVSCSGTVHAEVWDSDLSQSSITLLLKNVNTGEEFNVEFQKTGEGVYSCDIDFSHYADKSSFFVLSYTDEHYGDSGQKTISKEIALDCDAPSPVYFYATSNGDSGSVEISLNEKCSSGTVSVYSSSNKAVVATLVLDGLSEGVLSIPNLSQNETYYADLSFTDYSGNSYQQNGVRLFKSSSFQNVFFNSCDSDDGTFSYNNVVINSSSYPGWEIVSSRNAVSNGTCWYGKEWDKYAEGKLVLGPIQVGGNSILSFYHTFYLENGYDYGVIEISDDGGNTYKNAGALILQNGYNGSAEVADGKYMSVYTGGELGKMKKVIVSLSPYTGKEIYIRFRVYSDPSVAMPNGGWYIDDVKIESISGKTYTNVLVNLNQDTVVSLIGKLATSAELKLFDNAGNLFVTKDWTINSYSAIHKKLSELFPDEELSDSPYTLVVVSSEKLGVFQMDDFQDSRGNMRNWTEACSNVNSITSVVPHIAPEIWYWDTFVQMAYIGENGTSGFALSYYPLNSFCEFDGNSYHPFQSVEFDVIDTIFNNVWPEYPVGMANLYSLNNEGKFTSFCATEVFQVKDKDNSARLTLEQSRGNTLYVAHVDNSDYWWTGVAIVNPSSEQLAIVDIVPFDKNGNRFEAGRIMLNPGEKYAFVTKDSFPAESAWFVINSNIPVIGYELFGTMNRKLLAGLDLISRPSVEVLLPCVNSSNDWFGITIVNPFALDNAVTVKGYLNGNEVFSKDLTLDAYQKWVGLLSNLYDGDVDLVRVSSSLGVVSFCLEGDGHDDSTMTRLGGVKGFIPY